MYVCMCARSVYVCMCAKSVCTYEVNRKYLGVPVYMKSMALYMWVKSEFKSA